jgi:hypothetical protein
MEGGNDGEGGKEGDGEGDGEGEREPQGGRNGWMDGRGGEWPAAGALQHVLMALVVGPSGRRGRYGLGRRTNQPVPARAARALSGTGLWRRQGGEAGVRDGGRGGGAPAPPADGRTGRAGGRAGRRAGGRPDGREHGRAG